MNTSGEIEKALFIFVRLTVKNINKLNNFYVLILKHKNKDILVLSLYETFILRW